jgi:hypothetical protein
MQLNLVSRDLFLFVMLLLIEVEAFMWPDSMLCTPVFGFFICKAVGLIGGNYVVFFWQVSWEHIWWQTLQMVPQMSMKYGSFSLSRR